MIKYQTTKERKGKNNASVINQDQHTVVVVLVIDVDVVVTVVEVDVTVDVVEAAVVTVVVAGASVLADGN